MEISAQKENLNTDNIVSDPPSPADEAADVTAAKPLSTAAA